MSNYVKATNFFSKDALLTGNPSKIIKGSEIDDEYNAVAVAIATKANTDSPGLTGTPTAPTALPGTTSTQIASTAFVQNVAGNLGTMSTQNATTVAITGGTVSGVIVGGSTIGTNCTGNKTISISGAVGGSSGDVWYRY